MTEQQPTLDLQEIAEDDILAEEMGRYYADPLGFVYAAFDWDSPELREFRGPDEWAVEMLEYIGQKVRENKFDGRNPVSAVRCAISSGHGIGKGHPVSYIINTPYGSKRRWGDMKVGDYVFGADGKKTKIVATRHYRREHYEVIFDDRSSTIVSGEHEWQVRGRQERRKKLDTWRILTTEEIIRLGVQRSNGIATAKQWEIPTQQPVEYEDQEVYDPYLIGVWIGDGGKGSGIITSIDPCFLTRLEEKNIKFSVRKKLGTEALSIYVYGFVTELDKIKLRYCGSSEKFIPDCYKYNSVEKRLELLRGLLDTDGEVGKQGSIIYSTVSLQLANDIVWLARSLGGKARIAPTVKKPFYTGKNGEKIRGKDCYRCTLTMPVGERYFYLERKQERLKPETEHRYLTRWISEIKPVGIMDGMCIEVDNDDHLYLTNDFIVTHNSVMTAWLILWIMSTRPFCKGIVTANSYTQLETKTWAELGKWLKRCVTGHWFVYNASKQSMRLRHRDHLETWRCDAQSCVEANSESFAGLHAVDSTPFYIFDESCHDSITEVMTIHGWRLFSELSPTDLLLTPEGWQMPTAIHASYKCGEMLLAKKRGLSLCVTKNHDLWGKTQKGKWKKVKAGEISKSELSSPRTVKWSAKEYHVSDDELRLYAWYYSEGHLLKKTYKYKENGRIKTRKYREFDGFAITNYIDHGISELLDRLGLKWGKNRNTWLIYEPEMALELSLQGIGCLEKTLPSWMMLLSQRQIRVFLEIYILGDGYEKRNARVIYTSSERMANMLHALAVLAGYNASLTKRNIAGQRKWIKDHWAISSTDGFVINISETGASATLSKKLFNPIQYEGMVYCATVPAGLLLTRREGTVIWSGNSAIPDKIFEVAEGGLTDGEPMIFLFGNPTRCTGKFHAIFHKERAYWYTKQVDSRTVRITNKKLIKEWEDLWGEDSDFFRVRVKGEFPRASSMQLISTDSVRAAQQRTLDADVYDWEVRIMAIDIARYGDDSTVFTFRQGRKLYKQIEYRELDLMKTSSLAVHYAKEFRAEVTFIDGAGVGGGVVDRCAQLGLNVVEVNGGAKADESKTYFNKRGEMYVRLRDWLKTADIPNAKESDQLFTELTALEFGFSNKNQLILERKEDLKKRLGFSPDFADSLAMTFAYLVTVDEYRQSAIEEEEKMVRSPYQGR